MGRKTRVLSHPTSWSWLLSGRAPVRKDTRRHTGLVHVSGCVQTSLRLRVYQGLPAPRPGQELRRDPSPRGLMQTFPPGAQRGHRPSPRPRGEAPGPGAAARHCQVPTSTSTGDIWFHFHLLWPSQGHRAPKIPGTARSCSRSGWRLVRPELGLGVRLCYYPRPGLVSRRHG